MLRLFNLLRRQVHGEEPDFTNHAVNKFGPFVGTLDYVYFVKCRATDAIKLPHRDNVKDVPYPSFDEPSDHAMVWCDLEIC